MDRRKMHKAGLERHATGRNAASLKYDVLSALGAHGCAGDKHRQRIVLRLITLIVARYNWATDELAVGQREMAELWSIDERSVKRDIAKLREVGWLVLKHPAARGRVSVHGLDIGCILLGTRNDWPRVGPDLVARLIGGDSPSEPVKGNVISFPLPQGDDGLWPRIQAGLYRDDPNLYGAWFAALKPAPCEDSCLRLVAPSRFHADYLRTNHLYRLERLVRACDPSILRIEIVATV